MMSPMTLKWLLRPSPAAMNAKFKIAEDISEIGVRGRTELRGIAQQPGPPEIRSH
jgi:hypothetical protein